MAASSLNIVARLLWLAPALLLFLTVHQAVTAYQLRATWEEGERAVAEVIGFDNADRVDITYGYVDLRVEMPDGSVQEYRQLSLPTTLITRVEGQERLEVRVRPGAAQPIVIARLMPGHWLIAAAQSAIAFFGAVFIGIGVFWWNRYPAQQPYQPGQRHPSQETRARS